jgi:hypothetical protein
MEWNVCSQVVPNKDAWHCTFSDGAVAGSSALLALWTLCFFFCHSEDGFVACCFLLSATLQFTYQMHQVRAPRGNFWGPSAEHAVPEFVDVGDPVLGRQCLCGSMGKECQTWPHVPCVWASGYQVRASGHRGHEPGVPGLGGSMS